MRMYMKSTGTNNTFVRCCNNNGSLHIKVNEYVKSCNPIIIPDDDEFYGPKLQSCMNYVRSVPAMRPDCTFGPMEQVTAFIQPYYITTVSINFYIFIIKLKLGK